MRVQKVLVLTVATLVGGNNLEALADSQLSPPGAVVIPTSAPVSPIKSPGIVVIPTSAPMNAQYGGYVESTSTEKSGGERTQTIEVYQKVVNDIQFLFVNDKGQPVEGRTQREFLFGILKLKPGKAFSNDLLQADIQRLKRLDSLDEVRAAVEESTSGINVIYSIKERSFPNIRFGGGSNDDIGLYGQIGYEDKNISGLNDQLNTDVQISGKDVQFRSQFTSPYREAEPNRLGYSISAFRSRELSATFNDDIRLANGDKVREGRFGGSIGLLESLDDWNGAVALNYTRISLRNRDYDVVSTDRLGNPLSVSGTGIDDLFTVSFTVSRDQRDRRENPTQGSILSLSTEQGIPIGLGNISNNRLKGNYVHYLPVTWIGGGKETDNPEMLAVNLQLGTIIGEFPPADAFNIGGMSTVRGYGFGDVASGRTYGLASIEYRFPIFQSIGGVVFTDLASDFGSSKTVLGEPGVQRGKPGSGFGYGLGLRANTSFGLFRGDLGISDQGEIRFEVTTGQKF